MTGRVAYVNHRFPVLTQTFTVGEIAELESVGVPLSIFSLRTPLGEPHGRVATELASRTRTLPGPLSLASLRSVLGWTCRRPLRVAGILGSVIAGRYRDQKFRCWLRSFAQFAQGAVLASVIEKEPEIRHLHAQFLDSGSTAAWVAGRLTDRTFSFANHTAYNPYLTRPKLESASFATSISKFDRERVLEEAGRRHEDRVHVVRCGISVEEWSALERKPEPGLVLSVAGLREKKGLHVLVNACARLRDQDVAFRCEIVGEGPERARLEAAIERLDLSDRVALVGALSPGETRARYAHAEVFALPSVIAANGDLDGVPIVLMEAMMVGLPCVSTRLSGIPEIIEDGRSGLLAEPGDDEALARHLSELLTDSGRRESLGREARERALDICDRRKNIGKLAELMLESIR